MRFISTHKLPSKEVNMTRREVTDICGAVGLPVTCRVRGFLSSSGQRSVLGKGEPLA